MKIKTFLKKKNKIVKKATKHTLIPENQIIKVDRKYLENSRKGECLTEDTCPYCLIYADCLDCIMNIENNDCAENNSTWNAANEAWKELATKKDIKKLNKLINKYNERNNSFYGFHD